MINPAITTKFVRTDPSRICARMGTNLKTAVLYPLDVDQKERHCFAALEFARSFSCFGLYVGAALSGGMVWAPMPEAVELETVLAFRRARKGEVVERREWFYNPAPGSLAPGTVFPS